MTGVISFRNNCTVFCCSTMLFNRFDHYVGGGPAKRQMGGSKSAFL